MHTQVVTPDDDAAVAGFVAVANACSVVDSPWREPDTQSELRGAIVHGWDGEPQTRYLTLVDGAPAVVGAIAVSERDNTHLAWLEVQVTPRLRRRGLGTAMLAHLTGVARDRGRTSLGLTAWDATPGLPFATHHGFAAKSVGVNRRQVLAEVDWTTVERLHAEARAAASAYAVERRSGASPESELAAMATMTAAINDAPLDDLDIEDEVFDADRVRAYETAQLARGFRLHRVLVRHRDTGELAGHTVVVVDGERPGLGWQHDTSVVGAHRGHRLGLLLKSEMNLWLRNAEPQLTRVDTFNAESNDHMIGVNEQLGYRIVGRELEFQRELAWARGDTTAGSS